MVGSLAAIRTGIWDGTHVNVPVLRALKQRDFAILLAGQSVSFLGDGIFNVALAWQALRLPSGAAALGTVFLVRSLTRLPSSSSEALLPIAIRKDF